MTDGSLFFGGDSDDAALAARSPRIVESGVYRGPHYYSLAPMVRIQVDLGTLEAWPTDRIAGFTEALLTLLPGLRAHHCSLRRRGGFVERLEQGTWLGHVAEHVALELQQLAGHRVTRGKTRSVKGRPGRYNVMFAYQDEQVGLLAGRAAFELVQSLLPPGFGTIAGLDRIVAAEGDYDFERRLEAMRVRVRRCALGPTTRAIVEEARRRRIPWMRLDEDSLIQLGHGRHQQRIRASMTGRTAFVAADIAGNKSLTKKLLSEGGVPVPRGEVVQSEAGALAAARRLGFPLVVKPLDGNHGRGVTVDVDSDEGVRAAFAAAARSARGRRVIVEEQFAGRDHRILVIGGNVVAVAERVPAEVTGDGSSSIEALVARANEDPRRGDGHEKVMTRIRLDETATAYLARSGLAPGSVPAAGMRVQLRPTANLSTGGRAIDRTNCIHPENAEIARRAAALVGLDIAGIDFIAPDITQPVRETGGGVIEVNAAPGFRMHLEPSEGPPRDVARPVIDMLFPPGAPARIPIIAITGTNGKSTVGRMVKHVLRYTGDSVGLTSTTGVYVNDILVAPGDATGPKSARMVLRDPTVDVAVLETARGGILREGLGFEEADMGAVLNVTADHLGLKGIETLDDLAHVKSLVVETVRRGGASILNADDPLTVRMARVAGGRTIWFSLSGGEDMAEFLREHIDEGGTALVREPGPDGGILAMHDRGRREVLLPAAAIPATIDGAASFNIANSLAAMAICVAHGVPPLTLRTAMMTFQSTFEQNPGRLNLHDAHGFRVILDYAHNAAGLKAIGELVAQLRPRYARSLCVVSIAGDRRDQDIVEMGRLAGSIFDLVFFREDPSTRGRPRGEVMNLLKMGALEAGMSEEAIHLVAGEPEATQAGLRAALPGDLLVITPTDVFGGWKQVTDFHPDPARALNRPLIAAE